MTSYLNFVAHSTMAGTIFLLGCSICLGSNDCPSSTRNRCENTVRAASDSAADKKYDGLEIPSGPIVLVAQFSGLHDPTYAGVKIVDALMDAGIFPLCSGSRGVNVYVKASRASQSRVIIASAIRKSKLCAVVIDKDAGNGLEAR